MIQDLGTPLAVLAALGFYGTAMAFQIREEAGISTIFIVELFFAWTILAVIVGLTTLPHILFNIVAYVLLMIFMNIAGLTVGYAISSRSVGRL